MLPRLRSFSRPFAAYAAAAAVSAFAISGCEGDSPTPTPAPDYDVDVDAVCGSGPGWAPGSAAFVDATEAWGLDGLEVVGTRISVLDLDGDALPDLFVRRGGTRANDFAPGGVRSSWLLRNAGGSFVDTTEESGIDASRTGIAARPYEVVAFADVDNDGDVDAFTGLTTEDPAKSLGETTEVLLNDGSGAFSLASTSSDLRRDGSTAALVASPAGASFADIDGDGVLDLWVPNHNATYQGGLIYLQDRAYRGRGDGTFEDQTSAWGLVTQDWDSTTVINGGYAHSRAWGSNACDLDGDGRPELLASSYGRSPNHMHQSAGDADNVAHFNVSVESGYAFDDNRSWEDNQFARCFCQQDRGAEGCADVPASNLNCGQVNWSHTTDRQDFRLGGNSGTTVCRDVDNDGDFDLLTTEIQHWWAGTGADHSELLLNDLEEGPLGGGTGEMHFSRPGREAMGLVVEHATSSWDEGHMTATILDFDNDGWSDLYIGASDYPGNHGLLYRQASPLSFEPVSLDDGIDHNRSHGVAVADLDVDGDLDLIIGHSRSRCDANAANNCYETQQVRIFENRAGGALSSLSVVLEGDPNAGSNRSALGALVEVETTIDGEVVRQTRQLQGGHGHYGIMDDRALVFGLGDACDATVTVTWPNADRTQESFFVPAGYRYRVAQGEGLSVVQAHNR